MMDATPPFVVNSTITPIITIGREQTISSPIIQWGCIFLPIAVMLGFRNQELVAVLVMLGSATTVTCYVMARNMGHEGVLSSSIVMITTFCSAFTLTGWLWLMRSMGLI